MTNEILIKYSVEKKNLVKVHIMLLDLSGIAYKLQRIDQNILDFYLLTGSDSGMVLNWNGQEVHHPVACAKLISEKVGLSLGHASLDQKTQIDEICHLVIQYFDLKVIKYIASKNRSREKHLDILSLSFMFVYVLL